MAQSPSLRWLFTRLPVDPDAPSRPGAPPLPLAVSALLVAAGGVVGSLGRSWIAVALPHPPAGWPWSTVIVNVVGSGVLAFFLVILVERFPSARAPRPLIGIGVLGGFTTFSTFAVDVVQLTHHGRAGVAGLYVLVTLAGTGAAAVVGLFAARASERLWDRPRWSRRVDHAATSESEATES
jgi:fluoride exporter